MITLLVALIVLDALWQARLAGREAELVANDERYQRLLAALEE